MRLFSQTMGLVGLILWGSTASHADHRGDALAEALAGQFYLLEPLSTPPPSSRPTSEVLRSFSECGITIAKFLTPAVTAPGCVVLHSSFLGSKDPDAHGDYHFSKIQFLDRGQTAVGIDFVVSGHSNPKSILIKAIRVGEVAVQDGAADLGDFKAEAIIPGHKLIPASRQLEVALRMLPLTPHPRSAWILAQTLNLRDSKHKYRPTLHAWSVSMASVYSTAERDLQRDFLEGLMDWSLSEAHALSIARAFLPAHSPARAELDRPGLSSRQILTHVVATLGLALDGIVDPHDAVFLVEQLRAMSLTEKVELLFAASTRAALRHVFLERGGWEELVRTVSADHVPFLVEKLLDREANPHHAMGLLETIFSLNADPKALEPLLGLICGTSRPEFLKRVWRLLKTRGGPSFFDAHRDTVAQVLRGCSESTSARADAFVQLLVVAKPWINDLYLEFVVQDPNGFFDALRPRRVLTAEQVERVMKSLLDHPTLNLRRIALEILDSHFLVPTELSQRVTESLKTRARVETDPSFKRMLFEAIGRRVSS